MALERLSKEEVVEMFNFYDLIPIIKEYKNAMQKICATNKDGYKIVTDANKLQQHISKGLSYSPLTFSPSNPYTLDNIRLWLNKNNMNFELSSKNKKYIKNNLKLIWECPIHGEFLNSWGRVHSAHNNGKLGGCQKCGSKSAGVKNARTHFDFIILLKSKFPKVFNSILNFSSEYVAEHKPIYVRMKYGICKTTPHRLLDNKIPTIQSTINKMEYFLNQALDTHGDKYNYYNFKYKNSMQIITIKCKIHGDFDQSIGSHFSGSGCPKCGMERKGGWYNITNANKNKEEWIVEDCEAYIVKMFSKTESFIKIGITSKGIKDRFKIEKHYNIEPILSINTNRYHSIYIESELHKIHSGYKYHPDNFMTGWTETFSQLLDQQSINSVISKYSNEIISIENHSDEFTFKIE